MRYNMIEDLQKYHNEIDELVPLEYTRYENIFQIAKNNNYFFYNILKKVNFPTDIDSRLFHEVIVSTRIPYTVVSHQYYGTQDLWWLICLVNNITNPVNNITPGTKLKILTNDAVNRVLASIEEDLKK